MKSYITQSNNNKGKKKKKEFHNAYWNCAFSCFVLIVYCHAYVVYMYMLRDK